MGVAIFISGLLALDRFSLKESEASDEHPLLSVTHMVDEIVPWRADFRGFSFTPLVVAHGFQLKIDRGGRLVN